MPRTSLSSIALNVLSQFAASLSSGSTPGQDALGSQRYETIVYALTLLRNLGPGFDETVFEERADLIEETCSRVDEFGEILHKPISLLEHGRVEK